jgi:dephospho-CoA kinase
MHTIVLITGGPGKGKSFIATLMRNAVEIPVEIDTNHVTSRIQEESDFKEIAVVTMQKDNIFFTKNLESFAKTNNFKFQKINL